MGTRDSTIRSGRPACKMLKLDICQARPRGQRAEGRGRRAVTVVATLSLTLQLSAMISCPPGRAVWHHADKETPRVCA